MRELLRLSESRSRRAAVAANLSLIVLDIRWDRQVRDRFVETTKETLEARPSTG